MKRSCSCLHWQGERKGTMARLSTITYWHRPNTK